MSTTRDASKVFPKGKVSKDDDLDAMTPSVKKNLLLMKGHRDSVGMVKAPTFALESKRQEKKDKMQSWTLAFHSKLLEKAFYIYNGKSFSTRFYILVVLYTMIWFSLGTSTLILTYTTGVDAFLVVGVQYFLMCESLMTLYLARQHPAWFALNSRAIVNVYMVSLEIAMVVISFLFPWETTTGMIYRVMYCPIFMLWVPIMFLLVGVPWRDFVPLVSFYNFMWIVCMFAFPLVPEAECARIDFPGIPNSIICLLPALFILTFIIPPFTLQVLFLVYTNEKINRQTFLVDRAKDKNILALESSMMTLQKRVQFEEPSEEENYIVRESELNTPEFAQYLIRFDDLEIVSVLGAGAFGEVFKARFHGSLVAVKRLVRAKISEQMVTMLAQEIKIMASLSHPNIVTFIGGSWDNAANICCVLEFCERGSLDAVLYNPDFVLSWRDPLVRVAIDIVRGLQYLHGNGTIHRDLKSMNCLCSSTFLVKLGDFGTARAVDMDMTMTMTGTPYWIAPEAMRGDRYELPADIYSVGIILIELATRKQPYWDHPNKENCALLLQDIANRQVRPTIPEGCPACIKALAIECINDDPRLRPNADKVLASLEQARDDILLQNAKAVREQREQRKQEEEKEKEQQEGETHICPEPPLAE